MLLLWLSAQAAGDPPTPLDLSLPPLRCSADGSAAEVTVCGRRDKNRYRIAPQYRTPPNEGLGRAERRIGGVGVGAATERVDVGGWPSNRIMLTINIPL